MMGIDFIGPSPADLEQQLIDVQAHTIDCHARLDCPLLEDEEELLFLLGYLTTEGEA